MKKLALCLAVIAVLLVVGTEVCHFSVLRNAKLAVLEVKEKISETIGTERTHETAEVISKAAEQARQHAIIKSSLPFAATLLVILGVAFFLSYVVKLSKKLIFVAAAIIMLLYLGVFTFQTSVITDIINGAANIF